MDSARSRVALGFVLIFLAIVLSFALPLRAATAPPVEAFGAIPQVSDVVLSPDGTLLAWHDERGKEPNVVIFDITAQKYKKTFPVAHGVRFRSLTWADNQTLLVELSIFQTFREKSTSSHYEVYRTLAVDVDGGGKDRMLLMADGDRVWVTGANILAVHTPKPKTVIMSTMDYLATARQESTGTLFAQKRGDSGWVAQVFEVDTRTGKGTRIEVGTPFTEDWLVDSKGNVVARSEWDPKAELFTILAKNGGGYREILREQRRGDRKLYGVTSDGTAAIVSSTSDKGHATLMALPLDGSPSHVLLEDPEYDISDIISDTFTNVPIGASIGGPDESLRWFDAAAEKQFHSVAAAFPGKHVAVMGHSEDNKRVLAEVEGPSNPPVYYLIDFTTHKADIVGEAYPALANVPLGEVRVIQYKARDGQSVPAYLTLPPGSAGKNLPLVLFPHGGPEARDEYLFNWWAQFMASRGYAVLQPQFRGSTGFGEEWRKAGYRQWGKLMQDDLTDGVKALIEQGVVDAKRVCIVGGSYGGYAALAGAAFTPDLYRCAVSVNGISDLTRLIGFENEHHGTESDSAAYIKEHIGPASDPDVAAKSPVNAASQVKVPVLLLHSTEDTTVPLAQSDSMSRALGMYGRPVTFVKLSGDDHHLSQTATREQVLTEIDKFLATNLRATP